MPGASVQMLIIYPRNSVIRKVVVEYNQSSYVTGFRLFDADEECVLYTGFFGFQKIEILLENEDRIVRFKSRLQDP